jgi:hypothetical protein
MGERNGAYGVLWGNPRETNQLDDLGVNGRKILKFILKKWDGGMDWTDLLQDRDRVRAVVTAVMNLQVP